MATFLTNLWESVFTPGPTPTLLIATNASFAALQLLFLTLLIATRSIHFVILSILCAALWWAINWFSAEIAAAQRAEEEAKKIREARRGEREKDGKKEEDPMDTGDDTEGGETEVERSSSKASPSSSSASRAEVQQPKAQSSNTSASRAPRPETQSTVFVQRPTEAEMREMRESTPHASSSATTATGAKLAPAAAEAVKKRRGGGALGESTGDLSTDSEWEKLSQEG